MNFIQEQTVTFGEVNVHNLLQEISSKNVKEEIIKGLIAPQKYISSKFFYDEHGSALFEEITTLDAYYPTRCEKEILSSLFLKLNLDLYNIEIIELGSGDSSKITSILEQIPEEVLNTVSYLPVDISQSAIEQSIQEISHIFPLKSITGYVADFHHQLNLPSSKGSRLFCFLGSTLGNFSQEEIESFIQTISSMMRPGDGFLLGVDMEKDVSVIEAAYNDPRGITAKFNRNILHVINKKMNANFKEDDFGHYAFYNSERQCIEMHLVAKRDVCVEFKDDDYVIIIQKGESLHTENSRKFSLETLQEIAEIGDFKVGKILSDSKRWFNLVHYIK